MRNPRSGDGAGSRETSRSRNAAVRMALVCVAMCAVAFFPRNRWPWLLICVPWLVLAAMVAHVPLRALIRRVAVVGLFGAFMGLGTAAQPGWAWRCGELALRAGMGVWLASLLVQTTRWSDLLRGLRILRVPAAFVDILGVWGRYSGVVGLEWARSQAARRSRTFAQRRFREWLGLANTLGALLLRCIDRAEKVHAAMLARGYAGEGRGGTARRRD